MQITLFVLLAFGCLFVNGQNSENQYFHPPTVESLNNRLLCIAEGDFNGDGVMDVVTGSRHVGHDNLSSEVDIFMVEPSGFIRVNKQIQLPSNRTGVTNIAALDINNDDQDEILISVDNSWMIYQLNHEDKFELWRQEILETTIEDVAVGDLDNDGQAEVVVTMQNVAGIHIFDLSPTDSREVRKVDLNYIGSRVLKIADINSDGLQDLVCLSRRQTEDSRVSIYFQGQEGGFSDEYYERIIGDQSQKYIPRDFVISHRKSDEVQLFISIATSQNEGRILSYSFDTESESLVFNKEIQCENNPQDVRLIDLDQDGVDELVVVHGGWRTLSIIDAHGEQSTVRLPYVSNYGADALAIVDMDLNNSLDVVIADYNRRLIFLNNVMQFDDEKTEKVKASTILIAHPNPSQDMVTISFPDLDVVHIELFNILGKPEIVPIKIHDHEANITVSKLNSGNYLARISTFKEEMYTAKIIVK